MILEKVEREKEKLEEKIKVKETPKSIILLSFLDIHTLHQSIQAVKGKR